MMLRISKKKGRAEGHAEGHAKGHAEGDREACLRIAHSLKLRGFSDTEIAKVTQLTPQEIESL